MLLSEKIRRATYISFNESDDPMLPPCTAATLKESTLAKITGIPLPDSDSDAISFVQKHPVAAWAAKGAFGGHAVMGLCGGGVASLMTPLVSIVHLGQMGFDVVVVWGAMLAAGAVAHAAAPLVMGILGKEDKNPQGLCAKLAWGAWDGLCTPVMAAGYIGSRIGRLVGAAGGLVVGASMGAARQGAIWTHRTLLQPLYGKAIAPVLQCGPVQSVKTKAHNVTHCPLPNYSVGAHEAGLKLRACFSGLAGKATPSLPANGNAPSSPEKSCQTDTGGPQNG